MSDIEARQKEYARHLMRAATFNLVLRNHVAAGRPAILTARCSHYAEAIEGLVTSHREEPAEHRVYSPEDESNAPHKPLDAVASASIHAIETALNEPQTYQQAAE